MSEEYMEFTLPAEEVKILKELEHLMGSSWSSSNFRVENNHVIRIEMTRANLSNLPENIGDCRELKQLIFYGNKIEDLPNSIGNLTKLEWIGGSQNNIFS